MPRGANKLDLGEPFAYLSAERRRTLENKELIASVYANDTLDGAARTLDVSKNTLARALRYHGYKVRGKGDKITGVVELAKKKSIYVDENGDCSFDCPGRSRCLNGKCILEGKEC